MVRVSAYDQRCNEFTWHSFEVRDAVDILSTRELDMSRPVTMTSLGRA